MRRLGLVTPLLIASALSMLASRQASATAQSCARPSPGSVVSASPELFSANGALSLTLNYTTSLDADKRVLFCFVTPDGLESPTLHVKPGDVLNITLTNTLPSGNAAANTASMTMPSTSVNGHPCTSSVMYGLSVNIHFHGINASPTCHSDEVLTTFVNPTETYSYSVAIPSDEPPGLYWYHPHVHGISAPALLGGASGVIVVDGIEAFEPRVAKLPVRILAIRDQHVVGSPPPLGPVPSYDVSLNYAPVDYPALTPAVLQMTQGTTEFWRVVNASADLIADLQLTYDGVRQPLELVALDGVPIGSQDGTHRGTTLSQTDILLSPASRAEFIVTAPPAGVHRAVLETLKIHGGPSSDNNTHRILAVITTTAGAVASLPMMPDISQTSWKQRFDGLDAAQVTAHRKLYFSEIVGLAKKRGSPIQKDNDNFYITVQGEIPVPFDPNAPPSVTTTQGAVEDWVIENHTNEVHQFHIHQIHFVLEERNRRSVAASERQFLDTVQVPYWTGTGPYPSVTLRMDFRGNVAGDFVYHCHILDHEDLGMMEKIRVLPASTGHR